MSDGPYRVGSIQQLTSSSALQTGMSDDAEKRLRAAVLALAANDAEIERLRKQRDAYQTAVNRIDDFFEYSNESKGDRARVHAILADLTAALERARKALEG